MSSDPVKFNYFAKASTTFQPPLIANENAYLGDIATSEKADPNAPISAGFCAYRLISSLQLLRLPEQKA